MSTPETTFRSLTSKYASYTTMYRYYDGDQPLRYSTERLNDAFSQLNVNFRQNWCAVVIDSVLERLTLKGWDAKDETKNAALDEVWEDQQLIWDSFDTHVATLVTGEGHVLVWPDEENGVEVYWNDPRSCHVFYDPMRPKKKIAAAKWWVGDDDRRYLNLFFPDRIEHWASRGSGRALRSGRGFVLLDEPEENPYGEVPVFHFRRDRRSQKSELANIVPIQDAVNKLLADMMVVGEFGAFRQRVAITDADTNALKNAPNEIWTLPSGSTVHEFSASDLGNYLNAIDKLAASIAIISRTPKHYFYGQGGQPSGEALFAMEAPLSKKASQYRERFSAVWRDVGRFILKVRGIEAKLADIVPVWEPVETIQPETQAKVRQLGVQSGLPLMTVLRREGWSQEEVQQLLADRLEEKRADVSYAEILLENARLGFEQSGRS